jgi:hypothetical protein
LTAYHREVLKLHRSGISLREIAEQLGISHQRVHQIVGTEEPQTQKRRRFAGRVAVIVLILLIRMVQQAPPVARVPNADHPLFVCSIQPRDIIVLPNSKGGNATTRHAARPRAN